MTKRLTQPASPKGWAHPRLWLHRALHNRRVLQYRARIALIALVALLIAVIALKLSPLWLLLALAVAALPTPIRPAASLRELEASGGAYATALIAPPDEFGFQTRLESQALAQQKRTDLPAYPWLEGVIAAALCSLLLVFPPQLNADSAGREIGNPAAERGNDPTTPDATSSSDAPPVLDAPSRDTAAPSGDGDAKPGQSASGGSPGESNIGDLKPGGGNASEDPAAVSREFMDALERGAVRDAGSTDPQTGKPNQPQVQDNDASAPAGQQGSAGGNQGDSANDQSSSSGSQPNQNGRNGPGQGNQSPQGAQNPNSSGNNGTQNNGTQGDGQNGQPGNQPPNSSNGAQNGNRPGQSGQQNGRGNTPNPDEGQTSDGQGQGNRDNNNPTTTARGARGSSDPQAAERPDAPSGKLEYLPGTVRGTQVRSGALQLPGDPRAPLTGTPGTPAYRRAAEGAVLDPKLPPEYQELLKNYYR